MWSCSIWEVCDRSFLYLNDAWTQLFCENFCFHVMLFDISDVWWFSFIAQRYINTSMVERIRWCCDVVRCSRRVMLYFHFSTIHECEFVRIASVLMRSYWVWMMCDGSVPSLINTWTQVLCKCFCVHANFFHARSVSRFIFGCQQYRTHACSKCFHIDVLSVDVPSVWCFIRVPQQSMNAMFFEFLLHWCDLIRWEWFAMFQFQIWSIHERNYYVDDSALIWSHSMW